MYKLKLIVVGIVATAFLNNVDASQLKNKLSSIKFAQVSAEGPRWAQVEENGPRWAEVDATGPRWAEHDAEEAAQLFSDIFADKSFWDHFSRSKTENGDSAHSDAHDQHAVAEHIKAEVEKLKLPEAWKDKIKKVINGFVDKQQAKIMDSVHETTVKMGLNDNQQKVVADSLN